MIELSADPQWGGPHTRPQRTVERVDGGGNSYIIRDANRHELYSIKHAWTSFRQQVSLAAERWLVSNNPVVNRVSPAEQDGTIVSRGGWELHDVSDPKAARLVVSGMGKARMSHDNRWLFVTNEHTRVTPTANGGTRRALMLTTTLTIYRTETGEKVREVSAPPGMVFTAPKLESGGNRWAAFTSAAPRPGSTPISGEVPANQPRPEATPIPSTLRVFDTESGRELLSKDVGASITQPANSVTFSRDGRRAFVFSVEKPGVDRVQVVKLADGTIENTFTAAAEKFLTLWEETPDGKLILSASGELQLWDPLTGRLIHRLTGHSTVFKVVSSPDSRRLFVLDGRGGRRIHVWDLVSGRELLVLSTNQFDVRGGEWTFTFADGKVRYSSTDGMRVLDGSPRPEPK